MFAVVQQKMQIAVAMSVLLFNLTSSHWTAAGVFSYGTLLVLLALLVIFYCQSPHLHIDTDCPVVVGSVDILKCYITNSNWIH